MHQIGKRIKEIRISKNLKQQTVADAIGLSITAYSNIESGKTGSITFQRLTQILQLGVLAVKSSFILCSTSVPPRRGGTMLKEPLFGSKKVNCKIWVKACSLPLEKQS